MLIPTYSYTKKDLFAILGVSPQDQNNGTWQTGYIEYDDSFYLFVNIGGAGRTGHNYPNHWEDDKLVWYGKTNSRKGQPLIDKMLSGDFSVYIFTRQKDRDPFVYEGQGIALDYRSEPGRPIEVTWDITLIMTDREEEVIIGMIMEADEAIDDIEEKVYLVRKRTRKGQPKLKENQMKAYGGKCCVTGCEVPSVLKACHIEPHYLRGNNHSSNALLLRSDIHDLFDDNLIAIEPNTLQVYVSESIRNSEYGAYHGMVLSTRNDGVLPSYEALTARWSEFI